jgi:hypothetical protein
MRNVDRRTETKGSRPKGHWTYHHDRDIARLTHGAAWACFEMPITAQDGDLAPDVTPPTKPDRRGACPKHRGRPVVLVFRRHLSWLPC